MSKITLKILKEISVFGINNKFCEDPNSEHYECCEYFDIDTCFLFKKYLELDIQHQIYSRCEDCLLLQI